jgi:hypothetical protein
MDGKYPHWYHDNMEECCDHMEQPMMQPECMPPMMHPMMQPECCMPPAHPHENTFYDRLMHMVGTDVIFSVDARICGQESFCGILCHVGCDFIIVNVSKKRKPLSMMVPIKMIRFISPTPR